MSRPSPPRQSCGGVAHQRHIKASPPTLLTKIGLGLFSEDHTGEVIALGLTKHLHLRLSEDKRVRITTESGLNLVKATSLNNWTQLQCFKHLLHAAIGKWGFGGGG